MTSTSIRALRIHAIAQSLFAPTTLKSAVEQLGFVQADPIRAPARAQDLILRHRVNGYRAGELERRYKQLPIEEDVLYAYGFVTRAVWRLLHPRKLKPISALERKVFAIVSESGEMHPKDLERHLGRDRIVNAWGGYSKATTHALEWLHYRGLLRIARRENGIRVYGTASSTEEPLQPKERLQKLILLIATILAPIPEKTLHANVARYGMLGMPRRMVRDLVNAGQLQKHAADGVTYLWPAATPTIDEAPRQVRMLAPFDPLVWDRRRFEHFWQWAYRFEAYTPTTKRVRGYYALPLLWSDMVIGWANVSLTDGQINVDVGYVNKRPRDAEFRVELEAEIERMRSFLL